MKSRKTSIIKRPVIKMKTMNNLIPLDNNLKSELINIETQHSQSGGDSVQDFTTPKRKSSSILTKRRNTTLKPKQKI